MKTFKDLDELKRLYEQLNIRQFKEYLSKVKSIYDLSERDVKELLLKNNIPWVLSDESLVDSNINCDYLESLAEACKDSKSHEKSIEYCNLAFKINCINPNIYFIKAYCLHMLSQYEDAIYYYDKSIEGNSKNHSAYNNKASLLSQTGKTEEALKNFKRAIDIVVDSPKHKELRKDLLLYRNNISRELIKIGRYYEAEKYLKRNGKKNAESKYLLGHVYDNMGKHVLAMNNYKRALYLDDSYTIPMDDNRNYQINASKKKAAIIMSLGVIALFAGLYVVSSISNKESTDFNQANLHTKPEEISPTLEDDEVKQEEVSSDLEDNEVGQEDIKLGEETEDINNKIVHRIIVDTFSVKLNAEKQIDELAHQGIDATLLETISDGQAYYKVMAGSYSSKKNAISQLKNLKNRGYNPDISEAEVLR